MKRVPTICPRLATCDLPDRRRRGRAVAHALVRAASRLVSTQGLMLPLAPGIDTIVDAARRSACATKQN